MAFADLEKLKKKASKGGYNIEKNLKKFRRQTQLWHLQYLQQMDIDVDFDNDQNISGGQALSPNSPEKHDLDVFKVQSLNKSGHIRKSLNMV
jgi:hypothetical protein